MARTYRRNNLDHQNFFQKPKKIRGMNPRKLAEQDLEWEEQYQQYNIKSKQNKKFNYSEFDY